jgi:hypothetical protein
MFTCARCNCRFTKEAAENGMAIVRGQWSTLLQPGLAKVWFLEEDDLEEIERQDQMAILHPDTSKIPIWRRRPTRVEHPIEAWRAWGMRLTRFNDFSHPRDEQKLDAYLRSVAAECDWDGPVLRSHKRPVDPKYWDAVDKEREPGRRAQELSDTFHLAGVWSVKTKDAAIDVAKAYGVAVYGRIKLWGRVAQFELGYRAEVCMIDELWVLTPALMHSLRHTSDKWNGEEQMMASVKRIQIALENRYQCKVNLDGASVWP